MLQAAHQLFIERGYSGTSLGDVVKISGGSLATLYEIFENKEGLFRAVVAARCSRWSAILEEAEIAGRSPAEALRAFAGRLFDLFISHNGVGLLRQVIAEAPALPELGSALFSAGSEAGVSKIEAYLRRQDERGLLCIGNPRVAASMFVHMVLSDYPMRLLCHVPVDLSEPALAAHLDYVVQAFLKAHAP